MSTNPTTTSQPSGSFELSRLARIVDVVFAIVIWRAFNAIPRPLSTEIEWSSFTQYMDENGINILVLFIGVVVSVIYWIQNTVLLGKLQATDLRHAILIILQTFFLLIFLYSLRFGVFSGPTAGSRLFESLSAFMVGALSLWAWRYAIKDRRLLREDVSDEEVQELSKRFRIEPLTALITLPFVFYTPWLWEFSWFSYPIFVWTYNRYFKRS